MSLVEEMGQFVARAAGDDLSDEARAALKIRILDSLACAVGAIERVLADGASGEYPGR